MVQKEHSDLNSIVFGTVMDWLPSAGMPSLSCIEMVQWKIKHHIFSVGPLKKLYIITDQRLFLQLFNMTDTWLYINRTLGDCISINRICNEYQIYWASQNSSYSIIIEKIKWHRVQVRPQAGAAVIYYLLLTSAYFKQWGKDFV